MQLGPGTTSLACARLIVLFAPFNSANILADPSLWDSNFGVISLFGTDKFLQSDVNNMTISLQCIATFLKQTKTR